MLGTILAYAAGILIFVCCLQNIGFTAQNHLEADSKRAGWRSGVDIIQPIGRLN